MSAAEKSNVLILWPSSDSKDLLKASSQLWHSVSTLKLVSGERGYCKKHPASSHHPEALFQLAQTICFWEGDLQSLLRMLGIKRHDHQSLKNLISCNPSLNIEHLLIWFTIPFPLPNAIEVCIFNERTSLQWMRGFSISIHPFIILIPFIPSVMQWSTEACPEGREYTVDRSPGHTHSLSSHTHNLESQINLDLCVLTLFYCGWSRSTWSNPYYHYDYTVYWINSDENVFDSHGSTGRYNPSHCWQHEVLKSLEGLALYLAQTSGLTSGQGHCHHKPQIQAFRP